MGNNPSDARAAEDCHGADLEFHRDTLREGATSSTAGLRHNADVSPNVSGGAVGAGGSGGGGSTGSRATPPFSRGGSAAAPPGAPSSFAEERSSVNAQKAARANAQGVELLRQSQHEEAIRQFKLALTYETNSVQILNNIGLAYAKMQDFSGAYEWYEKAYHEDTRDVETLFSLAWVQRKRHYYAHAKELFLKVLQVQPEHVKALYLLGDILKTAHDYEGATRYFEKLIRLDPSSVDGHISLAQCYEHAKQYNKAAQLYNHVLQLAPKRVEVAFFLGRVYYLTKQYEQCLVYFDQVPDSDARGFEARAYMAKACREINAGDRAIANAERAAQLKPHADVMNFLAEEYIKKNDVKSAESWLSRAVETDPKNMATLRELGQLMQKQSRWVEAETYVAKLCELDSSNVSALRSLARVRFSQRKLDGCKQACEAALKLDLMHKDTLWLLAETHRLIGTGGGNSSANDDRWFLQLRYTGDTSVADICQAIAKAYLARKDGNEGLQWLQRTQHYLPSDKKIGEAISMLVRQSASPQEVADMLENRGLPARSNPESVPAQAPRPAPSQAPPTRPPSSLTAATQLGQRSRAELASSDANESAEGLERLLLRAERAGGGTRGSGGAIAAGTESQWEEVLGAARSASRKRPEDAAALRCVARALLALGGDLSEIRDYCRRATRYGEEVGGGFTLGHELHVYLGAAHEAESDWQEAERHYMAALNSKPGEEQAMLGLARVLVKRKQVAKARQLYEQVVSANPGCKDAAVKLAEISVDGGDSAAEAYRHAARAAQLAPSDASVLFRLGRAAIDAGRPHEEAAQALEKALEIQPHDVTAMITLANLQQKAGKDQDAIKWFKYALDQRPGDYDCCLSLAKLHAKREHAGASQALHYFRSALRCRPSVRDCKSIYLQMSDVHRCIGKDHDAQTTLESVVRDYPDDPDLWAKLYGICEDLQDTTMQTKCLKRLQQLGALSPEHRIAYGELLRADGHLKEARDHLEHALRETPKSVLGLLTLGACWRQEGNLDEAQKVFEQVLQICPQNAEALQEAAYCQRKANNLDAAIQLYQQSLRVRPTAEGPLYYLGDILYKQHRHAECQHYLQRLLATKCMESYKTGALYLLTKSHVSLGDYAEAEKQVRAGLELKPNHPHFLFMSGLVKNRMADYDTSITWLERALKHCDSADEVGGGVGNSGLEVECHDWLAQAHERKHKYTVAMEHVDIALKKDPSHVSSLITKGFVHIQLEQFDQAETALRRALAVEKSHALALVRLGYIKLLSGDHQEATQLFNRALQQRCGTVALPRSVKGTARVYLALTSMAQQDLEGALFQLAEAKKSHNEFAEVVSDAREPILSGEVQGVLEKLRNLNSLDVNANQARQLLQLMTKAIEIDAPPSSSRPPPQFAPEKRRWEAPPPVAPAAAAPPVASSASSAVPERRAWTANPAPAATPERRSWTSPAGNGGDNDPGPGSPAAPARDNGTSKESEKGSLQQILDPQELIDFSDLVQNECLGSGGFGAVYRGTWRGQEVAIKKLFCDDGGHVSPLQLEELRKEVTALRALRHERLVAFIGASLNPPNLCIITEFMPGGSLHHLLHKAKTPLKSTQQAMMGTQVTEGVCYLHGRTPPVVHRDLKSLNIVLDLEYNAKLCDFGLTQSMEKTHISVADGGNGGTPRYTAPECYAKGNITEKVDIWALGCILVEIFGGPLPYDDCVNIQQILAKVLIEKQAPYIPSHLPREVRKACEDCFHFDVKKRAHAQDVYKALRHLKQ